MLTSNITTVAVAGCLAAACGLYCLFVGQRTAWRVAGAVGSGVGLALLWSELSRVSDWWRELQGESIADSPLFAICGLAAIVAAGLTVTATRAIVAATWFFGTLCCTAALYALHNAQFLATTTLLVGAGVVGPCLLLVIRRSAAVNGREETMQPHEPLLACVCGGLLAVTLLGTFHRALAATEVRDVDRLPGVVARWQERATEPAGRRVITATERQTTQAGLSMFADHPVAMVLLMTVSLVAIAAAVLVVRGMESTAAVEPRAQRLQSDRGPV